MQQILQKAVSNLLSYQAKKDDVPCSADTHFGTALMLLIEMTGYTTNDREFQEIIDYYRKIQPCQLPLPTSSTSPDRLLECPTYTRAATATEPTALD